MDADGRPAIKARVAAPPVDGAANVALIKLLAKVLGVSKSNIRFVSRETGRITRLHTDGNATELENKSRAAGITLTHKA